MADTDTLLTAALPQRVRGLGIPIAAVALTSFFIMIGFPYHHVTNRVAAQAGQSLGVNIEAGDSGFSIGLDGVGFRFSDIDVATPNGDAYALDSMRFGPAWSLRWLTLTPTYFFEVDSALGHAAGRVSTGDSPSLDAAIREASLEDLHFLEEMLPFKITGLLSAEASIATRTDQYDGPFTFDLKEGALTAPTLPTEIAYDSVHGELILGGAHFVEVKAFDLLGPMFNAKISGAVGNGPTNPERAVDLDISLTDILGPLRQTIAALGATVSPDGSARMRIGGTVASPAIR